MVISVWKMEKEKLDNNKLKEKLPSHTDHLEGNYVLKLSWNKTSVLTALLVRYSNSVAILIIFRFEILHHIVLNYRCIKTHTKTFFFSMSLFV